MSLQSLIFSPSQAEGHPLPEVKRSLRSCSIIAVIGMIVAVSLAIIGIALTATGCPGAGVPLLILSVPLGYFSYNGYKVCANAIDVIANFKDYHKLLGLAGVDEKQIKTRLSRDTFCFDYAVDHMVSALANTRIPIII